MILALLFVAGVTFRPAAPTVGDLVTIDFPSKVTVAASKDFEVVSRDGGHLVVRTFSPQPFDVAATAADGTRVRVHIPIRSVLQANDPLTPAPLAPPRSLPYPRAPFFFIAAAALLALAVWTYVILRAKRAPAVVEIPAESAADRFRRALLEAQVSRSWGRLADETKRYLAATRPGISRDLTTTELVPRLAENETFVAGILRRGDLEKFSEHKPDADDLDEAARRALELAS
jgi:hypothetical protein